MGVAAVLMAGTVSYVVYDKELSLTYNTRRLVNASSVLAEFIGKSVSGVDAVLREGGREFEQSNGLISPSALQRKLSDLSTGVTGLTSVFTLNANGNAFAMSRAQAVPTMSFADRSYFTAAMAPGDARLHVSESMVNRVQSTWQFFASRPLTLPDGQRAGVIAASIDTTMFENLLGSYQPEPEIVIALYSHSFRLIARAPSDKQLFGSSVADTPLMKSFVAGGRQLISQTVPGPDGTDDHLVVVRSVPNQPLSIVVSVPMSRVLSEWRMHSRILLSLAGLMSGFIIFAGVAGARGLRRQEEVSSLLDTMFSQTPACIAISNVNGIVIKSNENWTSLVALCGVPEAFRSDVFRALRHAVISGGDAGLSKSLATALRDLHLAAVGLRSHVNLELRCTHEEIERFFSVSISRIHLSPTESSEGFAILVVDISKQRALELRLRSQLVLDSQTGLANREGFLSELASRLPTADPDDCLFTFDIVGLAELKEIRGFEASDQAFSAVGLQVGLLCDQGCIAGRLDSEKFSVFVQGEGMGGSVNERLQALIRQISCEYPLAGDSFSVRMTVGAARVAEGGREAEKLIQAADIAHSVAKRRGLASFAFFNAQVQADAHERVRLYESLQRAIANDEFELEFQPKVDLLTGDLLGAEALVRWRHPELGQQPPARFIPVAEESGLIVPIGDWVIAAVIHFLGEWQREDAGALVPISLNVSNAQFDREEVDQTFAAYLAHSTVPANLLSIEVTESVFSRDVEETVCKINRIRELGLKVSLDDFGTGYSSLSYLNLMNFDELKIDGSFVRKIHSDLVSRSIVEMTMRLAQTLNVSVTAEGVETEEQRQALVSLGCTTGQGFLFARSLPAPEFKAFAARQRRLAAVRRP